MQNHFFLGFKIDADVAPHYILYILYYAPSTLKSTMRSPDFLVVSSPRSSSAVESASACFVPDDCVICLLLSVSGDACLRVRLLIIRRICISSLTDLIICGILRVYTIDWVSSAMIWVGSALELHKGVV